MSLGEELNEAREQQGLSLEDLQEKTKIQTRYLRAIENNEFHILPGKFYARAFIKEYANALGLDPDALMEQYQDEIPQNEEEQTVPKTQMQRSRSGQNTGQRSSKIFSVIPTIIVVLLVIGIVFLAWYFIQMGEDEPVNDNEPENSNEIIRDDNNPDEDTSQDTNSDDGESEEGNAGNDGQETDEDANNDEEKNEAEEDEPSFTTVEKGNGNSPESTLDFTYSGEETIIEMHSAGRTWVDVKDADDHIFYSDFVTEEDSPAEIDVSDSDKILINVGNASELEIAINDTKLEYPVDTDVVHQKLWINLKKDGE